jgi:diaminopimelate decarboxylase
MTTTTHGFGRSAQGIATLGGRPIPDLLAESGVVTPAYFYDLSGIRDRIQRLEAAFGQAPHLTAYAVKANSAGTIVRTLLEAGAGIDAVSGGELELCQRLGAPSRKIVLSGVAKLDVEIDSALRADILAIQAESVEEVARIDARAQAQGTTARVSLRINPSVEIDSHAHVSTGHDKAKFGILMRDLGPALDRVQHSRNLKLVGMSTHVGSMLKATDPYLESARAVCDAAREALTRGHALEYVDFGGGFGIDYGPGALPEPASYVTAALRYLAERDLGHLMLVVEPGRSIVGSFGILVASVVQEKLSARETAAERRFLMIDAGMNDLLRPALYQAVHRIEPLLTPPSGVAHRVVGPVCESTDDFGEFAFASSPEVVVIRDAGAYGFTMASEYNGRALPAEVFVDSGRIVHVSPSPGVESWIARRLRA